MVGFGDTDHRTSVSVYVARGKCGKAGMDCERHRPDGKTSYRFRKGAACRPFRRSANSGSGTVLRAALLSVPSKKSQAKDVVRTAAPCRIHIYVEQNRSADPGDASAPTCEPETMTVAGLPGISSFWMPSAMRPI